jgi:hypothetical protein
MMLPDASAFWLAEQPQLDPDRRPEVAQLDRERHRRREHAAAARDTSWSKRSRR